MGLDVFKLEDEHPARVSERGLLGHNITTRLVASHYHLLDTINVFKIKITHLVVSLQESLTKNGFYIQNCHEKAKERDLDCICGKSLIVRTSRRRGGEKEEEEEEEGRRRRSLRSTFK